MRRLRGLRAVVTSAPFAGALVVLGLAAWAGRGAGMNMAIAAIAIAFGLFVGGVAEALVRLRYPSARRAHRSVARAFAENGLVSLGVHASFVAWSMADSPQLYAARWYAKGGLARTAQVLATDVLGPHGVVVLALAIAVIYVRPARLVVLARRAARAARRPLRAISARAAKRAVALSLVLGAAALAFRSIEAPRSAAASPTRAVSEAPSHAAAAAAPAPLAPATAVRRPNIVVLAVDSLRADRLDARVAPNLTRLAARGARFDLAYVSTPRSLPSWDALPERLAREGYVTGVVSDHAGGVFDDVDRGLARAGAPSFDLERPVGPRALERQTPLLPLLHSPLGRRIVPAMRALRGAADPRRVADDAATALHAMKDRPFFLGVAFSTARSPYAAPAPYYAKYTEPRYRGRFKYDDANLAGHAGDPPPDAADVKQIRALYDGAVSAVDDAVAHVLRALEREGLADNTIVVVTADRGETLFDEGRGQGHGDPLTGDEATHVPLVIVDPRVGKASRSGRVVRDVDLAPTLYELAGVSPPADLEGRSLAPALRGADLEPRFAYAETELGPSDAIPGLRSAMVRDERWKLVYVPARMGVHYILFDTLEDPGETRDLAASKPEEVTRLKAPLWAWMLRDPAMEQKDGFLLPRPAAVPREGGAPPEVEVEGYEVALRLVEAIGEARVDAPDLAPSLRAVGARRSTTRLAWLTPSGPAAGLVTRIALGTGTTAMTGTTGEESSEQRDALVAAPPTTFTFRVAVPRGASLAFSEGIAGATREATTFAVTAVDAKGEAHALYRHVLPPAQARRWTDATCSLEAFAGQTIELRLSTESSSGSSPALWGSPTVLTRTVPRVPYNVLWIAGGSRRSSGVTPATDDLAKRGVRFSSVYPAATSARSATVAMLGGARASELGLDPRQAVLSPADVARFYGSDPPLLPLLLRRRGVSTHAFANDSFMAGDVPGGVDMGFEHRVDRRRPRDALAIARDAAATVRASKDSRFFLFISYESSSREPANDDEAIGVLMRAVDDAGLRERTLVVLTSGPAETLIVAPGLLPEGREVKARVRTTDIAPTLTELLGLEAHPRFSGRSLVPLAKGQKESDERAVVTEGRGMRAILHGRHRLVVRDRAVAPATASRVELYDAVDDPGERRDLAPSRPELVAEMRARLDAAFANEPVAGSAAATATADPGKAPVLHLRFAGGSNARRVSGTIVVGDARTKARTFTIEPVELGRDALKTAAGRTEIAFTTSATAAVGFDIVVDPPATPVTWDLYLDDQPWPADAVFGGPYGLLAPALRGGVVTGEARSAAQSALLPPIDPRRDVGVFVVRERRGDLAGDRPPTR